MSGGKAVWHGVKDAEFEISPQTDKLNFLIKHHHKGKFQYYYSVHDGNHSGVGRTFVGLSNELLYMLCKSLLIPGVCFPHFSP